MPEARGRVLVIDDDEVVLIAITDLLEDAGYKVFSQTSPIGATSVISAESIDLAIIDINLPVMQGDAVVRLLRSWDKSRTLPIVIISGVAQSKLTGLQDELRNVRTLTKSVLQDELIPAIEYLLSVRTGTMLRQPRPADRDPDLGAKFVNLVREQLNAAPRAVRELRHGSETTRADLLRSVSLLRGQAHLLNLRQSSRLLGAMQLVLEALEGSKGAHPDVLQTLEDAMQALLTMSRADDFLFPPDGMIARLTQSLKQVHAVKR